MLCGAGGLITNVSFASYGTPGGSCEKGWQVDSACAAPNSLQVVAKRCIGKQNCSVAVRPDTFGYGVQKPLCPTVAKWLAVEYECHKQ
jgi:hypothetical protein